MTNVLVFLLLLWLAVGLALAIALGREPWHRWWLYLVVLLAWPLMLAWGFVLLCEEMPPDLTGKMRE